MARAAQDRDFMCTEPATLAAVLPPKSSRDPYFVIVGQDGSVSRLHRSRVERIVSDNAGRILEVRLAPKIATP